MYKKTDLKKNKFDSERRLKPKRRKVRNKGDREVHKLRKLFFFFKSFFFFFQFFFFSIFFFLKKEQKIWNFFFKSFPNLTTKWVKSLKFIKKTVKDYIWERDQNEEGSKTDEHLEADLKLKFQNHQFKLVNQMTENLVLGFVHRRLVVMVLIGLGLSFPWLLRWEGREHQKMAEHAKIEAEHAKIMSTQRPSLRSLRGF
jgi:hypothetical protein